jgi:uncharacterized membrane protein
MKKNNTRFLPVIMVCVLLVVVTVGCYNDREELLYAKSGAAVDCSTKPAKYAADVAPIMQNKCTTSGCHNAASGAAGVVLENHAQVAAFAARIKQRCVIDKTMPPGTALTPAEINILSCWISAGTPND